MNDVVSALSVLGQVVVWLILGCTAVVAVLYWATSFIEGVRALLSDWRRQFAADRQHTELRFEEVFKEVRELRSRVTELESQATQAVSIPQLSTGDTAQITRNPVRVDLLSTKGD